MFSVAGGGCGALQRVTCNLIFTFDLALFVFPLSSFHPPNGDCALGRPQSAKRCRAVRRLRRGNSTRFYLRIRYIPGLGHMHPTVRIARIAACA
jgi:hypothetical protein